MRPAERQRAPTKKKITVKSAGTLFRRLYAIQAYEDWCVEHLNKHWLPVSEYDVWTYVRWLQKTNAPATKAGSLVEALRFSWYLLAVEGSDPFGSQSQNQGSVFPDALSEETVATRRFAYGERSQSPT